ncbi:MAG: hypothetical protein B7X02_00300 [Rhodospirillales bacterium 12-54-5]|nr:MAG: hypothetical protein B7X02_00300 [Rhodospirillales bacterium 12-54-5]
MRVVTKDEACATAEKIGEKVREMCDEAGVELRDVKAVLENKIIEKPVQSSMIALGAGLVLGLLLGRK